MMNKSRIHLHPNRGLLNDPNGLIKVNGKYYIFYQHNPYGKDHANKHWSLFVTTDFINYKSIEKCLVPETFDKDGCYSGGAAVINDDVYVFYTANYKQNIDEINFTRKQSQCVANFNDGKLTNKKIVIENNENYTGHFRDPAIFKQNEYYYMLLGAQDQNLKGKLVLYKSIDGLNYHFLKEIEITNNNGYMIECPDIINMGDKNIIVFSVQNHESKDLEKETNNPVYYYIFDNKVSIEEIVIDEYKTLDYGFDLYAPQFIKNSDENIFIGWLGQPYEEYDNKEFNYEGYLSLPICYQLDIGELKFSFHRMLEALLLDHQIDKASNFYCNFEAKIGDFVSIKTKENEFKISILENIIIFDRSSCSNSLNGLTKNIRKVPTTKDIHNFEILLDGELMHIIFDGNLFSARVRFEKSAKIQKNNENVFIKEVGEIIVK